MQGDGEKEIPFFFTKEKRYAPIDLDVMSLFFSKEYAGSRSTLYLGTTKT